MRLIPITMMLAAFASATSAQVVYKYSDTDGGVLYTDKPAAGKGSPERLEIPQQSSGRPAAALSNGEKQLLESANRRAVELDRAAADIVSSHAALRAAEARRAEGAEPLDGERYGRRFRSEYRERQQALARDVEEARARLDEALARRNAFR